VSVYHRGKRIAFAFRGIPEDRLRIPDTVWEVDTSHEHQRQAIRVRIEHDAITTPSSGTHLSLHAWVLVGPRLNAKVRLELLDQGTVMAEASWSGRAYRDHNFGQNPLQADFKDWYWGRVQGADHSLVFLHTLRSRANALYVAEVREGESEVRTFSNAEVAFHRPRLTLMGLRTHREVQITATDAAGDRRSLVCFNRHVVEDGPFYQRYLSEWWLDDDYIGIGTSEYMDASRLGRGWVRPFLRLPWFSEE